MDEDVFLLHAVLFFVAGGCVDFFDTIAGRVGFVRVGFPLWLARGVVVVLVVDVVVVVGIGVWDSFVLEVLMNKGYRPCSSPVR